MDFRIEWPAPMDEYDWAVQEAKGWLNVTVVGDDGDRRVVVEVYDPVRLAQTVADELRLYRRFTARRLVVVSSVTPENVESAITALAAEGGFFGRG